MTVKQTQLSYDEHWLNRKVSLGNKVTWKLIVRAGIIALEEVKKNGDLTQVVKNLASEEKTETKTEESPKEVNAEKIKLILSTPKSVIKREFDVLRDNKWQMVPLSDIIKDEIFRIRDDNTVTSYAGSKSFSMKSDLESENGLLLAEVVSV